MDWTFTSKWNGYMEKKKDWHSRMDYGGWRGLIPVRLVGLERTARRCGSKRFRKVVIHLSVKHDINIYFVFNCLLHDNPPHSWPAKTLMFFSVDFFNTAIMYHRQPKSNGSNPTQVRVRDVTHCVTPNRGLGLHRYDRGPNFGHLIVSSSFPPTSPYIFHSSKW